MFRKPGQIDLALCLKVVSLALFFVPNSFKGAVLGRTLADKGRELYFAGD